MTKGSLISNENPALAIINKVIENKNKIIPSKLKLLNSNPIIN
jgi:hypothetical protein